MAAGSQLFLLYVLGCKSCTAVIVCDCCDVCERFMDRKILGGGYFAYLIQYQRLSYLLVLYSIWVFGFCSNTLIFQFRDSIRF